MSVLIALKDIGQLIERILSFPITPWSDSFPNLDKCQSQQSKYTLKDILTGVNVECFEVGCYMRNPIWTDLSGGTSPDDRPQFKVQTIAVFIQDGKQRFEKVGFTGNDLIQLLTLFTGRIFTSQEIDARQYVVQDAVTE